MIKPKVSIIIPTRDRTKSLAETLASISKMDYPKDRLEIIVIDNASKEKVVSRLKNIKIIRNKTNRGFAPAVNQGIKRSNGKYVLVTNDDVLLYSRSVSEMVDLAESDSSIGITTGKMFFRNQPKKMAFSGFKVNLWLGYHPYDNSGINKVRDIDVATGGCMLIRKTILKKVGLFDEKYFFCGEDYDFCFRTRYVGFKVMYTPKAWVWHGFLGSGSKSYKSLVDHYYGKFRFVLTHASIPQILFFFPFQMAAGLINFLAMADAGIAIYKNMDEVIKTRKRIQKLKGLDIQRKISKIASN